MFGNKQVEQEGHYYHYQTNALKSAALVDLLEMPETQRGLNGGGTKHHVAFRVNDEETLMAYYWKMQRTILDLLQMKGSKTWEVHCNYLINMNLCGTG